MKSQRNLPEATSSGEKERQRKRDAIARGRADVAAGQVVAHEDVRRWLESWGNKTALLRLAPWHRT